MPGKTHALTLGAVDLVHPIPGVKFTLTGLSSDDGTDFGEMDPEIVEAMSYLMDGATESVDRMGNREVTIGVTAKTVYGGSSRDLAAAEAALMAEVGKRNELVWTPPQVTRVNMLANGGFELDFGGATEGDGANWEGNPTAARNRINDGTAYEGDWYCELSNPDGRNAPNLQSENETYASCNEGDILTASAYIRHGGGSSTWEARLDIQFFDATDNPIEARVGQNQVPATDWDRITTTSFQAPAGVDHAQVRIMMRDAALGDVLHVDAVQLEKAESASTYGGVEPAVFDVMTSWLDFDLDDFRETKLERRYVLTLRCLPYTRSQTNAVAVGPFDGSGATPATPTETMLWETVDGLTDWTSTYTTRDFGQDDVTRTGDPDISDAGWLGQEVAVGSAANVRSIGLSFDLTPSGSDPIQYVRVAWTSWGDQSTLDGPLELTLDLGNRNETAPIVMADGTGTLFGPFLDIDSGDVTAIHVLRRYQWGTRRTRFGVKELATYDAWPYSSGTVGSQQSITLDVKGTARTEASLYVGHDESALGDVLVWTGQQLGGYDPPLTQYRTAGSTPATSTSRLSGSSRALNGATPETSEISSDALPKGSYNLAALLRADTAGGQTITWTASTLLNGNELTVMTGFAFVELTTDFQVFPIERIVLPTVRAQSDAMVRITLKSSGTAYVDEWWAFYAGDPLDKTKTGALTHVKCGTGTPASGGASSRLWLDTASVTDPVPSIWLGTETDKSDARHANAITEALLDMPHSFSPGPLKVFVASTNAANVAVRLEHAIRWHTYPGSVS